MFPPLLMALVPAWSGRIDRCAGPGFVAFVDQQRIEMRFKKYGRQLMLDRRVRVRARVGHPESNVGQLARQGDPLLEDNFG